MAARAGAGRRGRTAHPPAPVVVPAPEPVAAPPEPVVEPAAAVDDGARDAAARLAALGTAAVIADAATPEPAGADRTLDDKMASQTTGLLKRFRPGQSLDAEIASYERTQEAPVEVAEAVVAAEVISSAAEPAETTDAAPSPLAAAPTPEPVVREPDPVVPVAPAPTEPVPPTADVVSQPTWQMVAPDPATDAPSGEPSAMPAAASAVNPSGEPQWPERPQWLGGGAANGLPFLNRPATPQGGIEALWAQSNAEVADPTGPSKPAGGTQPCVSCGLSLSATARFCRRCGTPQAG